MNLDAEYMAHLREKRKVTKEKLGVWTWIHEITITTALKMCIERLPERESKSFQRALAEYEGIAK